MENMKIINLKAENIKRLKAVEIHPDDNIVQITGKNGQGKTSILDAIFWGLGGKRAIQGKPIRDGEETASVEIDLGDLIVKRRFKEKGVSLIVENKEGAKFSSPQELLNNLCGRLTFDPQQFLRMKPEEQTESLKLLAGLDFTALDFDYERIYNDRREINRDVKSLQNQLSSIDVPEGAADEEIDAADIIAELQEANENNDKIRRLQGDIRDSLTKIETSEIALKQAEDALEDAKAALLLTKNDSARLNESLKDLNNIETQPLQDKLNNIKTLNDGARLKVEFGKVEKSLQESVAKAAKLSIDLQEIINTKTKAIQEANMPIEGLSIKESEVFYNDIPLSQASGAEQLRVSMAMAMAMNPNIRILRITDGSLLDSDSMAIIEEMAKNEDFQIWIERVDESGKVGIVIEDGEVKTNDFALA